ncbi:MAG: VWA domain-containing protein [Anaerolineales bacterium]
MKKNPLFLCGFILLLTLLIPAGSMSAAPPSQSGSGDVIQIVLVLDVSGSMGTPVYTGIVPEDLLSLLLRMDELQNDPEYLGLTDQMEAAENDPGVVEAKNTYSGSYNSLSDWITKEYGVSLPGIQAMIRSSLTDAGCDDVSDNLISTAGTTDQIMFYLNADCPYGVNKYTQLASLQEFLPYLNDPQYQELREVWQTNFRLYNEALELSGYASYAQQLEEYKTGGNFQQIQVEIDRLVDLYSIPSRLELAKSAAINLIDLSQLDKDNTGRESLIGLVTFSNQAMFEHGLTLKHDQLKPLIRSMVPLQQTNIGDALVLGLNELESNADPEGPMLLILLSDGHANVGLSSSEILAVIPERANSNEITLCTAGFADLESEVDFVLLEGLAFQTGGKYLFTNSGAELGSFFAACREAAAGKELAEQITGIINSNDFREIGRVDIMPNTCDMSLSLNFLGGEPIIELIYPDGKTIDTDQDGVSYQFRNQVQLLTIENPPVGEWIINLGNENSQGEDSAYSLLISTNPCDGSVTEIEPTQAVELPYFVSDQGMPAITAGIIVIIILLAGATGFIILIRQRRPM